MVLDHRYVYAVLGLASLGCIAALWVGGGAEAASLSTEDGLVQTLSAVFWLVGMVCSALAIRRRQFVWFAWLWLGLCFVFLGEETSWFQRYLGYSVPAVERVSNQGEFNIHNLVALGDAPPQVAFMLGMLGYFLLLPVALLNERARSMAARVRFPDPTIALGVALWLPVAISYLPIGDREVHHGVVETREMLCAFFAMVYTFSLCVHRKGVFRAWPPPAPTRQP